MKFFVSHSDKNALSDTNQKTCYFYIDTNFKALINFNLLH